MKKKRINLLQNRYDYYALEKMFLWLKRGVFIGAALFVLLAIGLLSLYGLKTKELASLDVQKKLMLLSSDTQKSDEAKLLILSKKLSYYKEFMKDDAQFVPYYNLLLEALKTSSQSGQLSTFDINKKHEVIFTIHFNTFDEMNQSFAFIESDKFLKNFKALNMLNFFGLTDAKAKYELTFKGVFKDINEVKN